MTCPFCPPRLDAEQIVLENADALFLRQPQPVLIGSGIIIPRFKDEPFAGRGIRYWLKQEGNRRG